jgi:hypothetical protein
VASIGVDNAPWSISTASHRQFHTGDAWLARILEYLSALPRNCDLGSREGMKALKRAGSRARRDRRMAKGHCIDRWKLIPGRNTSAAAAAPKGRNHKGFMVPCLMQNRHLLFPLCV